MTKQALLTCSLRGNQDWATSWLQAITCVVCFYAYIFSSGMLVYDLNPKTTQGSLPQILRGNSDHGPRFSRVQVRENCLEKVTEVPDGEARAVGETLGRSLTFLDEGGGTPEQNDR